MTKEQINEFQEKAHNKGYDILANKFDETKDPKYVYRAYREGFDVDYIPGQDDGERPLTNN